MADRVLVTGATGLIGRPAVGLLAEAGYEVHAVAHRRSVSPAERGAGVIWHNADLLAAEAGSAVVFRVRPSLLLHLAWSASPGGPRSSDARSSTVPPENSSNISG